MNILTILCDQLRYDALSCNGAPICRTPNIDSIARRGARMDRCYTVIALCSPARATLFTGKYPHMHGQLTNLGNFNGVFDRQLLPQKGYSSFLKQHGYSVGYAGKWHLPAEGDRDHWGFDQWYTAKDYHDYLATLGIDYNMGRDEVTPIEFGGGATFHGRCKLTQEQHEDSWATARTCDMMTQFSREAKNFMICTSFHGPHFPYAVPAPYDTMYSPGDVPRYENFDEMFHNKPIVQQMELLRWNTSHLTWPDWQKVIATYWGYVSYLDSLVGQLLKKLKELGIEDETAIIFTADHGDMLGGHRLFNKGFNMYEEAHHIPFIAYWPGVTVPNAISDGFCGNADFFATLLDMAGVEIPAQSQGKSLRPLMQGELPENWQDDVFCEFNGYESTLLTIRMVRTDRWKYVYNPFDQDELYDMQSDPGELRNLAPLPAFAHILRRMRARMLQWLQKTEDGIVDVTTWQSNSYRLFVSDRER
jgi:choline-sulfatase